MQDEASTLAGFTRVYAETNPPWDIGKPQPPFIAVADQVVSPMLDAGCGTGGTSVFFAARGEQVTGIDFVEEAIRRARIRARESGVPVEFLVKDAMTLRDWERQFATVIDSGLFHIYAGDEQRHYVQGLAHFSSRRGGFSCSASTMIPRGPAAECPARPCRKPSRTVGRLNRSSWSEAR